MLNEAYAEAVSYTHLDVYKRQVQVLFKKFGLFFFNTPRIIQSTCRRNYYLIIIVVMQYNIVYFTPTFTSRNTTYYAIVTHLRFTRFLYTAVLTYIGDLSVIKHTSQTTLHQYYNSFSSVQHRDMVLI